MTVMQHPYGRPCRALLALLFSGLLLLGPCLAVSPAQVPTTLRPDGTLGTTVTQSGNIYDITGGTRPENGPNLFHSFNRFTVGTGDTARFSGPTGIKNILSRVTGGQQSLIDGRLQSTANLYLLNPSGVLFGSNASLDVNGSFHVSTADYLRFADRTTFSAHLGAQSTLTMASPEAFGFLTQNPARIAIQGSKLGVSIGETLSIVGGAIEIVGRGVAADDFAQLSAPSGRINIASVASPGEVTPNAPGGNPDLGMHSFARLGEIALSQNVTISVAGDPGGTVVIRSGRLTMDDTRITAATRGDADHPGIGVDVHVTGDMILTNRTAMPFSNAEIASSSFGAGDAGDIRIVAGSLQLIGNPSIPRTSNIGSRAFGSGDNAGDAGDIKIKANSLLIQDLAFVQTSTFGSGAGGNITIEAGSMQVLGIKDTAFISASSFGAGNAGSLDVHAESVLLRGGGEVFTGLSTQVSSEAQGRASAGDLRVTAGSVHILDGAEISAGLFTGAGRGGNIAVHADMLRIAGFDITGNPAGINSGTGGGRRTTGSGGDIHVTANDLQLTDGGRIRTFSTSLGNSGNIAVRTGNLQATNGAFLSSANLGGGKAGNIDVRADSIRLAGPGLEGEVTGLFAFGTVFAQGAGDIRVMAKSLEVLDGAQISSRTTGPGNGGTIAVTADIVRIGGVDPGSGSFDGPSAGIFASTGVFEDFVTQATGRAGEIRIQAGHMELRDQGAIRALSESAGDGGNINIRADRLTLASNASISAASTRTGNAGSITITATDTFRSENGSVTVAADQAEGGNLAITASQVHLSNGASVSAKSAGVGNAGSVHITATDTFHSEKSTVTTEASQADGGNIQVTAQAMVRLRDSRITTTVGGGPQTVGGNITIDPEFVILQNSQVVANAFEGRGGNIQITAGVVLADPASVVSASSALGINGVVDIRAPVTNVSGTVAPLPQIFVSAAELLRDRCAGRLREGKTSRFVMGGRDGVPLAPGQLLLSPLGPAGLAEAAVTAGEPRTGAPASTDLRRVNDPGLGQRGQARGVARVALDPECPRGLGERKTPPEQRLPGPASPR